MIIKLGPTASQALTVPLEQAGLLAHAAENTFVLVRMPADQTEARMLRDLLGLHHDVKRAGRTPAEEPRDARATSGR